MTTSVFLSYARGDDEPFVHRLHGALVSAGFRVWFDRVSMPHGRQLTFHQEIRDAILRHTKVVYVAGPMAADSAYVADELAFAIQSDTPVVPILRCGDMDVLPDALVALHCEDFRSDRRFRDQLERLMDNLRQPEPPLGSLHNLPPVAPGALLRKAMVERVKEELLGDLRALRDTPVPFVGVHGLGGAGKTTLAVLVAQDQEVRRSFPDGVIWATLGSAPDLGAVQRLVFRGLGEHVDTRHRLDHRSRLTQLLGRRAVLLILDDVWRASDIKGLAELGPRSRALVTTRDASILRHLQVPSLDASSLNPHEALVLLARAARRRLEELPAAAREVGRMCEGLPLALALCGRMAAGDGGVPWAAIEEALKNAHLADIADDHMDLPRHRSVAAAIRSSVEALPSEDATRWAQLAVFQHRASVPVPAVHALWMRSAGLDSFASQALIQRLQERGLVTVVFPPRVGAPARLGMHSLLGGHAGRSLSAPMAFHRLVAEAAWETRRSHPADFGGYMKESLPFHLARAREPEWLLRALSDPVLQAFEDWAEHGLAAEGAECLEYLLSELPELDCPVSIEQTLATQLGRVYNRLGDVGAAERWLARVVDDSASIHEGRVAMVALHEVGSLRLAQGDRRSAADYFLAAFHMARRASRERAHPEVAANLIGLASVAIDLRPTSSRAFELARIAAVLAERAHDWPHLAEACRIQGDAARNDLRWDEAHYHHTRGVDIARAHQLNVAELSLLVAVGWSRCDQVQLGLTSIAEAEGTFRNAIRLSREIGMWRLEGAAWAGLGTVAAQASREPQVLDEAIEHLERLPEDRFPPHLTARLVLLRALRVHRSGQLWAAVQAYERAEQCAREAQVWPRVADALVGLRQAQLDLGETRSAQNSATRAWKALIRCSRLRRRLVSERLVSR